MNNNDLKDRWKAVTKSSPDKSDDPFTFWDDQKKMQEEDKKLASELKEAKRKARELKKTLYKNKYGETKNASKEKFGDTKVKASELWQSIVSFIVKRKKLAGVALLLLVAIAGFQMFTGNEEPSGLLGDATTKNNPIAEDLPREKPGFKLLFPSGTNESNYDVVRISPPEADASYTYLDQFTSDGQVFKVTQQEIPDGFELADAATDFQATSIIQVDDNQIFHGYSEQGGIQSVLFVKDKKLILIRSPQKFSDDAWANYFISLK